MHYDVVNPRHGLRIRVGGMLCEPIKERKFNINSISSLIPKLNLHGMKSITTRQMAIESTGEVCSISMLDGSRINIGGLFYKDDTDPGRASQTMFIVWMLDHTRVTLIKVSF